MSQLNGSCLCGAVHFEAEVEQPQVMSCYCTDCQHCTGSACATFVVVPAAQMQLDGSPKGYTKKGDEGRDVTRFFCTECGSQLYSEVEVMPGMRFVKIGVLDDNSAFAPSIAIFTDSKPDWAEVGAVAASFPRSPAAPGD